MTRRGWIAAGAAALALSSGGALGQSIVYQQDPAGASILGPFANFNHSVSTQRVADNFSLTSPTSVSQVAWWGWTYNNQLNQQGALGNITGFDIRILAADGAGGVPGTVIYQETVLATGITTSNYAAGPLAGQTYEFRAPLLAPVPLAAGTTYWIAINAVVSNQANSGDLFVWLERPVVGAPTPTDIAVDGLLTLPDGVWEAANTDYDMSFHILAVADSDNDGLTDVEETTIYFTNPNNPDTDGDGLLDGTEAGDCNSPIIADSDGDGLSDGHEVLVLGTDPCLSDTDGDGLPDGLDPDPINPPVSNDQIADTLRATGDLVLLFDLESFSAPNANVAAARRNTMANRFYAAAFFADRDLDIAAALLVLTVQVRIDGDPFPPDWLLDSADRDVLLLFVDTLMDLLIP